MVARDVGALTAADVERHRALPRRPARHDDPRVRRRRRHHAAGAHQEAQGDQGRGARAREREDRQGADRGGARGRACSLRRRRGAARSRRTSATTPGGSPPSSTCCAPRTVPTCASASTTSRPYLGEAGAVPSYLLTNAIEEGDAAAALEMLHRLLTVSSPQQPKPMHPLQMMGAAQRVLPAHPAPRRPGGAHAAPTRSPRSAAR